jgi:hypothetical protein
MGVFPATLCPFHQDETLDESGLRAYISNLCRVPGLKGLVPNGHTGEIMSLRENERARVTRIVAEEVKRSGKVLKVISGVCGEGSLSAIDHAIAAKEAGADEEAVAKLAKRTVKVTKVHNEECKRLLRLLGVPVVDAPSEAEAQCAALVKQGLIFFFRFFHFFLV